MNTSGPDVSPVFPDGRPESQQPAWRRDFPIDWPQDHYVARRDFTKFLGLTSLAFVVGQVWIGVQSWVRRRRGAPAVVALTRLEQVPVGAVVPFTYPGPDDPCLLLRPDEATLLGFGQKCTHLSCAVVPEPDGKRLACPCHHGYFDAANGRPVAGPPRRPLPRVVLKIHEGTIYAVGVEETTV